MDGVSIAHFITGETGRSIIWSIISLFYVWPMGCGLSGLTIIPEAGLVNYAVVQVVRTELCFDVRKTGCFQPKLCMWFKIILAGCMGEMSIINFYHTLLANKILQPKWFLRFWCVVIGSYDCILNRCFLKVNVAVDHQNFMKISD